MRDFFTNTGRLDNESIREKIFEVGKKLKLSVNSSLIDHIIDQFWFHDFYNSFIADEDYFGYLLKYLEQKRFKKFNRLEYYNFLFSHLLNKSERPFFHKVGLFFEGQQTDTIVPEKYNQLLKERKLPVKILGIETLTKRHLAKLSKREGVEYLIWEHHTITEFLVADYLVNQKQPIKEFEKLATLKQEGIIAFKPSWSGVLRFLLESNNQSDVLNWLLSFLKKYSDNLDDTLGELITFIVEQSKPEINSRVFNLIYNSYFYQVGWMPVWVRSNLYKFIDEKAYRRLKSDIKEWCNKTETFVRRGNVVAIVGGMLEKKHPIINRAEKNFWKKKLVEFAINPNDDGNGVLQRHALKTLESFDEEDKEKIIKSLDKLKLIEASDTLIREAFIELCYSFPNSQASIDYLIAGLKKGSDIYARHGLYLINKTESLIYFLTKIADDEVFLKEFLKHESIFDKEEGDWQILNKIRTLNGSRNLKLLKKLFYGLIRVEGFHHLEQSGFIQQLALIINLHDKKFLFELIKVITEADEDKAFRVFYDLRGVIALLLTPQNLLSYLKGFANLPEVFQRRKLDPIYIARRTNKKTGELVYQKALKFNIIEDIDKTDNPWGKQEEQRKKSRLDEFLRLLEPEKSKYFFQVFKYYLQNKKELDEFFETEKGQKSKQRLIKLVMEETLEKADPRKFNVKLAEPKNAARFTWSTVASYYGDVLEISGLFHLCVKKYRQRIIDFIPYCFSPGQILRLIEKIEDKDLSWVNQALVDLNNGRRYLIPSTYIYLIEQYVKKGFKLKSAIPVLLSFLKDPGFEDRNKVSAVKSLSILLDKTDLRTKGLLKNIVSKTKDERLKKVTDDLLIKVYHEDNVIKRRFKLLKNPLKFNRDQSAHWHTVSDIEEEIDSLSQAKALIELKDIKYLPSFFDLLEFSLKHLQTLKTQDERKHYWEYTNYLWKIVTNFVDDLKEKRSFKPFLQLEQWVKKHHNYESSNWLLIRIKELRKSYINFIGIVGK